MSTVIVIGAGFMGTLLGGFIALAIAPQIFVTLERYTTDQNRLEGDLRVIGKKLDRLLERNSQ